MILVSPDCLSTSSSSMLFSRNPMLSSHLCFTIRRRTFRTKTSRRLCVASSLITSPESFEVGRLIGSYGFMNITSYSAGGMDFEYSGGQLKLQDVGEGSVKIRLYEGRIAQGSLRGTPVVFKVYPGQRAGGIEADMMAANELNAHAALQSSSKGACQNLLMLVGGFETKTGEQVCYTSGLLFVMVGNIVQQTMQNLLVKKFQKSISTKETSWNHFEQEQKIKRRRYFVIKLLQGAITGLAYMHYHDRLHQSLGPSSVVLNTIAEREAPYLVPRLRDLAFSVDMRISNLEDGLGTLSEGLWRRAIAAGASTPMEKRAFGIADDIYEAGLLLAYLAFVPFCEAGIVDTLSLQRLLENTFRLDVEAMREYCLADDRLEEAVKFLDLGDRAGWQLLQAMLNPDFRKRPIAEAVLKHRFMIGAVV
ncbi:hypothetical protein D5086_033286 [Populus alba]|uniref:Uncharacterized protein n=1 Tax=Populus alba TaxID=43335 RepID=A0ACC4AGE2_POPAL